MKFSIRHGKGCTAKTMPESERWWYPSVTGFNAGEHRLYVRCNAPLCNGIAYFSEEELSKMIEAKKSNERSR